MRQKEEVSVTNSFEETQNLGKEFAARLLLSNAIALYGDLGSGKTTFVQGLAKGLGITRRIISPTFIIIRSYKIRIKDKGLSIKYFYHIDLYRMNNRNDIVGLGIEEIIKDPQNIVAIEWAEKICRLLPEKRWDVRLEYVNQNKRRITIENGKN